MPIPIGNLLVVDDNPELKNLLAEKLSGSAASVRAVSSGTEALALITAGSIDAVLCDVKMPDMTGLELLAYLRALNLEIPVVFLTGFVDRDMSIEALRLGALDILEKPFQFKNVLEVMRKALVFGVAIKKVETEIEELCLSETIPVEQRRQIENLRESILTVRKIRHTRLKTT